MNVCSCCFSDEEIKQYIVNISAQKGTCSFCNNVGELIDIEEIIDFFEGFLSIYQFSENASESLYVKIQKDWSIFSSNLDRKSVV